MPRPSRSSSTGGATIPELASLRGIAISLVVLLHTDGMVSGLRALAGPRIPIWRAYVLGGWTGVSLFFILSGFLLSRPFLAEAFDGRRVSRGTYAARRMLRILPLYYTAIVVASLWCARQPSDLWRALPFATFLNSIEGMAAPLPPFSFVWWSLATEAQFYVLLPLLPWLLASARGRRVGIAAAVVYAAAYVGFAFGWLHLATLQGNNRLVHSFVGRLPLFAFGVLAAALYERKGEALRGWAARVRWMRWGGDLACLAALALLGMLLQRVVYVNYFELETRYPAWHLLEGACWTSVLLLVLLAPLRLKILLSNRVLATLGTLSYSIYLIHVPVLTFGLGAVRAHWAIAPAGWDLPAFAAVALLFAGIGALSALTYRVIERPMLERKARLRERRPAEYGQAIAGALPSHVPPVEMLRV